jgi:enterochelin esterase-like enzyme
LVSINPLQQLLSAFEGDLLVPKLIGVIAAFVMVCLAQTALHASELGRQAVASPALARDMPYTVYLPDGYDRSTQSYPVLYLLHGAGGDDRVWSDAGAIKERADRLIAAGTIPPAIIIMPACNACWWIDGAKDQAETAFWADLVPAIDQRFRTISSREGRFVAGISAGGYGAVRYALAYPEKIAAVAALSPAVYAQTPPSKSGARLQGAFLGPDGTFNQKSWTAHNYPALISTYSSQPLRVPFYLVSGDGDPLGIAFETALLFKTLREVQPDAVELRVVDGEHGWGVWGGAMDDALKYLFRQLKSSSASAGLRASGLEANPVASPTRP